MKDLIAKDPRQRRWRNVWLDGAVLCVLLAAVNAAFRAGDIGMLDVNPTPLLALPILLGLWYGFVAGLSSGGLLAVLVLLLRALVGQSFDAVFHHYSFTLLALPLAGGLCGEVFRSMRSAKERAEFESHFNGEKLRSLGADVEHLRQVRDRLERFLLKRDTLVFSFDNEIRALHDTPQESFPTALLQTLNRTERVYNAGVYLKDGTVYRRGSCLGDESFFPETLTAQDDVMVAAVLETNELAALPSFIGKEAKADVNTRYVAAFPLVADGEDTPVALVLIAGIPFIRFERNTLRRIDTFCRWAAQILDQRHEMEAEGARALAGRPGRVVVSESVLTQRLALAVRTYENLQVPYTLLLAKPVEGISQEQLETLLVGSIRAGDSVSVMHGSGPNLVLLAPFTGERARAAIDGRLRSSWKQGRQEESALTLRYWDNDAREAEVIIEEVKEACR